MATPTIVFNNSTGSDTQASGAGPSTAVFGTNASFAGTPSTVTLDGSPDLTNVATDGSHALYIVTSTGRQWSTITAKNNTTKTVTIAHSLAGTTTGRTWAIGGKRSSLDHAGARRLFSNDWLANWKVEIEYTGSNYTVTSTAIDFGEVSSKTLMVTGTGGTPTITQSANAAIFTCVGASLNFYMRLENFILQNTNGTKTSARGFVNSGNTGGLVAINVQFGTSSNKLLNGVYFTSAFGGVKLIGCYFLECTGTAAYFGANNGEWIVNGCTIRDSGGSGIYCFGNMRVVVVNSIITGSTSYGIHIQGDGGIPAMVVINGNTIHDGDTDGIWLGPLSGQDDNHIHIFNNNITSNGGYGVNNATTPAPGNILVDYNNIWNNTSGQSVNITLGSNNLNVDPDYVDAGTDDYTPQEATLEGAALPTSFP